MPRHKMNSTFYDRSAEKDSSLQHASVSLIDNTHGDQIRVSVPIKQYSNKFFRDFEQTTQLKLTEAPKFNNQKRFNTLLKKKQMFGKHTLLRQPKDNQCQVLASKIDNDGPLMTFSRKGKSKRVFTEPCSNCSQTENAETNIVQLEQELIINQNLSSIGPSYSSFLKGKITEPLSCKSKRTSQLVYKETEKSKISQSRGLELFSKLYIKQKSLMVEKLKQSPKRVKRIVSKEVYNNSQNIFEAKKLYPIEKTQKRQQLMHYLSKKPKVSRTPMRLINNNYASSHSNTLPSAEQSRHEDLDKEEDFFELKGWETIN